PSPPTSSYTLSLHDALPIYELVRQRRRAIPPLTAALQRLVHESPEVGQLAEKAMEQLNGRSGDSHSFDALHRLLEAQVYRLAHRSEEHTSELQSRRDLVCRL